jgi:hypothetical protein
MDNSELSPDPTSHHQKIFIWEKGRGTRRGEKRSRKEKE